MLPLLNPASGQTVSGVAGFTYNFRHPDTQVQSGVDFDADPASRDEVAINARTGVASAGNLPALPTRRRAKFATLRRFGLTIGDAEPGCRTLPDTFEDGRRKAAVRIPTAIRQKGLDRRRRSVQAPRIHDRSQFV